MKNIVLIIVGLIFLIFVAICPFPTILGVPGVVWRIIIALFACCLLALGIYKFVHKNNSSL